MPQAVLTALGLREARLFANTGQADPVERLTSALADRRMLLVFDNCEHVVEDAAARAAAVAPDVELDDDMVQRICLALDGLPLAIELAAARLRTVPLAQLELRLEDRFRLLSRGDPHRP